MDFMDVDKPILEFGTRYGWVICYPGEDGMYVFCHESQHNLEKCLFGGFLRLPNRWSATIGDLKFSALTAVSENIRELLRPA